MNLLDVNKAVTAIKNNNGLVMERTGTLIKHGAICIHEYTGKSIERMAMPSRKLVCILEWKEHPIREVIVAEDGTPILLSHTVDVNNRPRSFANYVNAFNAEQSMYDRPVELKNMITFQLQ